MKKIVIASLGVGALVLAGCSGDAVAPRSNAATGARPSFSVVQGGTTPASISITPATAQYVLHGTKVTYTATVKNSAGQVISPVTVLWTSTVHTVTEIGAAGIATGNNAGATVISATIGALSASASFGVTTLASVLVDLALPTLSPGAVTQATATLLDPTGHALTSGTTVTWTSANPAVASVTATGAVTAMATGTTTITASSGGKTGSTSVTVQPQVTTEPSYNAAHDALIYSDSFDKYASAHAMWTATGSATRIRQADFGRASDEDADSLLLITPGRNGSGKAIRMVYSGTYQDGHDWDLLNAPVLPDTTTHNVQYWARVTVAAPLGLTTVAVKWFMGFHRDGTRVEWDTHDHLPCPAQATRIGMYWDVYDQAATPCQGNQPVGPYPVNIFDGQWHRFTYEFRANTKHGSRDGIARMWIDGTKVIDISSAAAGLTPAGGYKTWSDPADIDGLSIQGISFLRWGSTLTTSTPPFTIDIDDLTWWRAK